MIGFALDQSGDVVINNGKIEMVADEELTRQTVQTVVGTNKGEWFLNEDEGIDFHVLLTKNPDYDTIKGEISNGVKQVDEELTAGSFDWYLSKDRKLKVNFGATTKTPESDKYSFNTPVASQPITSGAQGGSIISGGTEYYNTLKNKPTINGVELNGDLNITEITQNYTGTLTVDGWSDTAPYIQTVAAEGITSDMSPVVDIAVSDDIDTAKAEQAAWSCITKAVTGDGVITFYCYDTKPETAVNFKAKAV